MIKIEIYALKIEKFKLDLFNKLLTYISKERRNRIERCRNMENKYKTLLSELLIRYIVIKKLNIYNDDIKFDKNKFGRPFLENNPDFYFNISHSGEWIICAIDNENIGIDIEKIRTINYKDLAENFFSKKEYEFIFCDGEKEEINNFFRIWTLKESYIKACGKGLAIPLKDFSIDINKEGIRLEEVNDGINYYFKEIEIDNSYKSSICTVTTKKDLNIIFVKQKEFISMF